MLDTVYLGNKNKLTLFTEEGYMCVTSSDVLQRGFSPSLFINSNPHTIANIKLWCKINNKAFNLISSEYLGNDKKLQWKCLKDGCEEIFEANWDSIFSERGCGYCAGKQVGLSNCLATKNPALSSQWHQTKNTTTQYEFTCNSHENVWWLCPVCNNEWKAGIGERHSRNHGCPECNKSKGEAKIAEVLNKYNIRGIPEYVFKGCRNVSPLPFDSFLPKYNTTIEYQGLQHYEPVDFAGKGFEWANENFKLQ